MNEPVSAESNVERPAGDPPVAPAERGLERHRFPGFGLSERLRSSRVGIWFRAHQHRIGRDVLLKVPARGDPSALEELRREVWLLGRNRHPGLITLFDFQTDSELPHAVYEFPGERSLELHVEASGGLSLEEALDVALQMTQLFSYLHSRGVHVRQASPAEFFIDEVGRVRLAGLEAANPGGIAASELSPLWAVPGPDRGPGDGEKGDLFLLGLHLYYLLTAKVPVPQAVRENPSPALEAVERSLGMSYGASSISSISTDDVVTLLRELFAAPDAAALGAASIARSLEALRAGHSPLSARRRRALTRAALFVPVLIVGAVVGSWIWRGPPGTHSVDAPPTQPTAPQPVVPESPRPTATSGVESVEAGPAPDAPRDVVETPVVVRDDGQPPQPGATDLDTPAPIEPPSVTSTVSGSPEPAPAIPTLPEPAPPPDPIDELATATREALASGSDATEITRLWRRGLELARSPGGVSQPPGVARETLLEVLVDLGTERQLGDLRRRLFSGEVVHFDGESFEVRYDFSSRRQLEDWKPARGRVNLDLEALTVHGDAVFQPAVWLRDSVEVELHAVRSGNRRADRGQERNLNLVIWLARADSTSAFLDGGAGRALLFGIGAKLGQMVFKNRDGEEPVAVLRASTLVLDGPSSLRDPRIEEGDSRLWTLLWKESAAARRRWVEASRFRFKWTPREATWEADGKSLLNRGELSRLVPGVDSLEGRRFAIGLRSFDSRLEIDEIRVKGVVDPASLRAEARRRAAERVRAELATGRTAVSEQ